MLPGGLCGEGPGTGKKEGYDMSDVCPQQGLERRGPRGPAPYLCAHAAG